MSRRVSLSEIHKARAEQQGDPPVVELGGKDYILPLSLPISTQIALGEVQQGDLAALKDLMAALFGAEADEVIAAGFDLQDLEPIFTECYGMNLGEPPASGG